MKFLTSIYRVFLLVAVLCLFYNGSCKKEEEVCAKCVEMTIMFHADDFCDTPSQVDWYIENLVAQGAELGQQWVCTIE